MIDYTEIEKVLDSRNITPDDKKIIKDFLVSFSFTKRQQLMEIFLGHPEKIQLFVDLLKKKIKFAKKPTEALSAEILESEASEIKKLMKELE